MYILWLLTYCDKKPKILTNTFDVPFCFVAFNCFIRASFTRRVEIVFMNVRSLYWYRLTITGRAQSSAQITSTR